MLASVVGKHYYTFVRSRVLDLARNLFLEAQAGGISGRSTDFSAFFFACSCSAFPAEQALWLGAFHRH
eukprot:7521177-Karenia_brevis.AAC.1